MQMSRPLGRERRDHRSGKAQGVDDDAAAAFVDAPDAASDRRGDADPSVALVQGGAVEVGDDMRRACRAAPLEEPAPARQLGCGVVVRAGCDASVRSPRCRSARATAPP